MYLLPATASCTNLVQKNQISRAKPTHYDFSTINFTVWNHIPSTTPMLFQQQVKNASFVSKRPGVGFHAQAAGALEQTDTKTCHVSVVAQCSFPLVGNYTPRNMSLKTRTLKPTTHRNMSSFSKWSSACFNAQVAQAPQTYPTETCNISGVMFQPHPPIYHVPHAILIHAP